MTDAVLHAEQETAQEPPKPCTVTDGRFLEPCWALRTSLNPPYSRAAGLAHRHLVDLKTLKPSRSFAVLRFNKQDIVLNFCPFCGQRIDEPMREEE